MNTYRDIVLIDSTAIIDVVRRSLSKIDPRLVEHGERVAYIAKKVYDASDNKSDFIFSKLFILCVLHDIGAYKTNEIDDMVRFETENDKSFDHALYGYLFLKNTSHLSEYAEALLYHHTNYQMMSEKNCRYSQYAELIYLADRTDILLNSPMPDLSTLKKMSGFKFNPTQVEALFRAEESFGFAKNIISGSYRDEIADIVSSLDIKSTEVMDYLRLLVYAIDFRSPYTVTHTADTTIISLETGKLMGLSEHELQKLYTGAFLHDIGKIAIPHDILEKPGKLTPSEYATIKQHIPEGENILRGVVSDEICDIALRHHEKLDGSGYMRGLTAGDLTLSQRIVAVSDIMSALSQRRSYKEPFRKDKVITILTDMKNAGQLCPLVVDTVCMNYDMILSNTEKSHDPVKTLYENLSREYTEYFFNHSSE